MLALAVGTLLVVLALAYVLYPLVFAASGPGLRAIPRATVASASGDEDAVVALREIEFDRATGKLSDADYADLKARYTQRALEAMRAEGVSPADAPVEDVAEAAVLAYRARIRICARCGPRPEPDAIYCSSCGAYLDEKCAGCGRIVEEAGAAFCAGCGRQLAA
jgi:ribosomal protein L40E